MSTANSPDPLQSPRLPRGPGPCEPADVQLRVIARWAGWCVLFYLLGPVLLFAAQQHRKAAGSLWQAEKRWASVTGSAVLSLLWYLPLVLFHAPLAAFWTALFATLAIWLHLPFLARLGGTMLLPPVPASLLLRWVLALPLAGLLATLMEMIHPRTTWSTQRVLTPEEQLKLTAAAADQEKKTRKTGPHISTTPTKRKRPEPSKTAAKEEKSLVVPKADSLWGSIDWKTVPDTHPTKQAALQAAADQRREEERARFLAQQRAAHQRPSSSSAPIIDATPPAHHPSPAPAQEEYNWDEGEGSIQEER